MSSPSSQHEREEKKTFVLCCSHHHENPAVVRETWYKCQEKLEWLQQGIFVKTYLGHILHSSSACRNRCRQGQNDCTSWLSLPRHSHVHQVSLAHQYFTKGSPLRKPPCLQESCLWALYNINPLIKQSYWLDYLYLIIPQPLPYLHLDRKKCSSQKILSWWREEIVIKQPVRRCRETS